MPLLMTTGARLKCPAVSSDPNGYHRRILRCLKNADPLTHRNHLYGLGKYDFDIEVSGVTKLKDLHQLRKRCLIHFEQKVGRHQRVGVKQKTKTDSVLPQIA